MDTSKISCLPGYENAVIVSDNNTWNSFCSRQIGATDVVRPIVFNSYEDAVEAVRREAGNRATILFISDSIKGSEEKGEDVLYQLLVERRLLIASVLVCFSDTHKLPCVMSYSLGFVPLHQPFNTNALLEATRTAFELRKASFLRRAH